MKTPATVRNQNPVAIDWSPHNDWNGQIGNEGRFATFSSPEYGFRAGAKILLNYQSKHGLRTISDMIHRYTPPMDTRGAGNNHTDQYIDFIVQEMRSHGFNVSAYKDLPLQHSPRTFAALLYWMSVWETGHAHFTMQQASRGVELALELAEGSLSGLAPVHYREEPKAAVEAPEAATDDPEPETDKELWKSRTVWLSGLTGMFGAAYGMLPEGLRKILEESLTSPIIASTAIVTLALCFLWIRWTDHRDFTFKRRSRRKTK